MASHRQRTLVVVRHAKADWPDVPDHERPLADSGRHDAPEIGNWLVNRRVHPDHVVCSTAARTRETWKLMGKVFDPKPHTVYDDRLYEATAQSLLYVAQETADDVDTLVMIGHNPGVATLVSVLAGSADGDALERAREKYATSGVALLRFEGAWGDLNEKAAHLAAFATPRA
ncbi:SixA phosphatase family protein [Yinghuangia seranimata]|uniref:SixA phosphatase family protein n=1 Tax=Yinghuangia seranimata TaxID=408067 RepID=UPI00248BD377|nr:histidine phosphatase family protein [Yinghuangia seranimata]MDI2126384.1 histidine phosphatase family protein [Yinghuangia seranimata]